LFFHRRRYSTSAAANETAGHHAHEFWRDVHAAATAYGMAAGYTRSDVEMAFRRLARRAHPDMGGTHEAFQTLIAQRDLLLSEAVDQRLHVLIREECPQELACRRSLPM
jgi:hypothetical protein